MISNGKIYLIPVPLGDESFPSTIFSSVQLEIISSIKEFVVENEKSARAFLKKAGTKIPMPEIILHPIGKHISVHEMNAYLNNAKKGETIGLLSEAGCPGVADPGAEIVRMAHDAGIAVIPLIGPSSLLLALMGSGKINVKPLISRTFDFQDSVNAFNFAVKMPADCVKAAPGRDFAHAPGAP